MNIDKNSVIFLLVLFAALLIAIQWFCWIFGIGRFKPERKKKNGDTADNPHIRYIIANLLVNIINDFRHLLALVIVSVFAVTLFVVLYKNSASEISAAMQSVSSTFGGLIGAIIGFYFGERSALRDKNGVNEDHQIEEQADTTEEANIIPIPEQEGDGK